MPSADGMSRGQWLERVARGCQSDTVPPAATLQPGGMMKRMAGREAGLRTIAVLRQIDRMEELQDEDDQGAGLVSGAVCGR